jgi:hypothetical protein
VSGTQQAFIDHYVIVIIIVAVGWKFTGAVQKVPGVHSSGFSHTVGLFLYCSLIICFFFFKAFICFMKWKYLNFTIHITFIRIIINSWILTCDHFNWKENKSKTKIPCAEVSSFLYLLWVCVKVFFQKISSHVCYFVF